MGRSKPTRFLCERKLGRKVSDESPARSKSLLFVAGSLTTGPYARSAPFARKRKGYHQPAARGFICSSGPHKVSILMALLATRSIPPTGPRHLRVRSRQLNPSRRRATIEPTGQSLRAARSIFLTATVKESRCGLVEQFIIIVLHDWPRFRFGLACQRRKGHVMKKKIAEIKTTIRTTTPYTGTL